MTRSHDRPIANHPIANPPIADPPIADPLIADPPIADPPIADPPIADPPIADPPIPYRSPSMISSSASGPGRTFERGSVASGSSTTFSWVRKSSRSGSM